MGARPSRPVKTTQVLAVCFLNGINRHRHNTHADTQIHCSINRQTYRHNINSSARICQHHKASNDALCCTSDQPPGEKATFNNRCNVLLSARAKNSFSIYPLRFQQSLFHVHKCTRIHLCEQLTLLALHPNLPVCLLILCGFV